MVTEIKNVIFVQFQVILFYRPFIFDEMFYLIYIVYLLGILEKSRCFSKKLKFWHSWWVKIGRDQICSNLA